LNCGSRIGCVKGTPEFAGLEMQDWNLTDKVAGVENAGLENDGLQVVNLHGT